MEKPSKKEPTEKELEKLGVKTWGIWEKEPSKFDWYYDSTETFYVLEGEADVETKAGDKISFKEGDMVTFPQGIDCTWNIKRKIRKHYKFED